MVNNLFDYMLKNSAMHKVNHLYTTSFNQNFVTLPMQPDEETGSAEEQPASNMAASTLVKCGGRLPKSAAFSLPGTSFR